MMDQLIQTLSCYLVYFLFKGCNCVQRPAYISAWTTMDTSTTTELEFTHGLGQVPYMHEVQVRSLSGFVYPGVKTAFSDDDASTPRGGVVCIYNANTVKLYAALDKGAYLIHTGQSDYTPENQEVTTSADVRVRLWIASNFPVPDVVLTSTLQAGNDAENHRILVHNLGSIPELTVVQLEVVIDSQVWYGEGVGTSQHLDGYTYLNWGGVVFGVSSTQVRLWAPSDQYHTQSCLNFCDGWGPFTIYTNVNCETTDAKVTVRIWASLDSNNLVDHSQQHFIGDEHNKHEYTINPFDEDNDFITVQSRSIDGDFSNYYFDGTGAAMFDNNVGLGGLIYAYKASTGGLRIWHPNNAGSYIIKVGPYMGSQTPSYAHASTSVTVVTRVWQGLDCGNAPTVVEATFSETSSAVTYTCVSPYVLTSGNLVRTCQTDGTWNGTSPVCTQCYEAGNMDGYVGTMDTAYNGDSCVNWDNWYSNADNFPDDTLADAENYCRNPDGHTSLWCLTKIDGTYETCNVPLCGELTTAAPTTPLVTTPLATTPLPPTTPPVSTPQATTPPATTLPVTTPIATTLLPTTAASAECTNCVCYNYSSSSSEAISEAIAIAQQIVVNLTIPSKSTSKHARSLSSAVDERQSSFYIGMLGAGFCGTLMLLLIIPDIIKVASYIFDRHTPHERLTKDADDLY